MIETDIAPAALEAKAGKVYTAGALNQTKLVAVEDLAGNWVAEGVGFETEVNRVLGLRRVVGGGNTGLSHELELSTLLLGVGDHLVIRVV